MSHCSFCVCRAHGQPLVLAGKECRNVPFAAPIRPTPEAESTCSAELSSPACFRLVNGDKIPVRYLTSDPDRVMYSRDELSNPWGWLLVGVAAMFTAFLSRKLLRKEYSK